MAIGEVSVHVVPDARAFWTRFREQTSGQGEREGRRQGDEFRRGVESSTRGAKVRVTGDTTDARAKLSALEAELRHINIARLSANFDDKRARAQIAALRTELKGLSARPDINTSAARGQLAELSRQIKDTEAQEKSFEKQGNQSAGGLLQALLPLAPALTPLAAAATASAAGLVGMAAAGVAGFQGLRHEMALGTSAGDALNSTVDSIKSNLGLLEARAGRGVFVGAAKSLDEVNAKLPTLGAAIQREGGVLGDSLSHVTDGLLQGFTLAGPIMDKVSRDIDHLAIKFDKFASGPQGAKFANALLADYQQVAPVLGSVAEAIGRIIAAGQNTGLSIVTLLGTVADVINAIPLPVLDALVFSFAAIKTSLLLSGPIKATIKSLVALNAASKAVEASNYSTAASNGALGNAYIRLSAIGKVTAAEGAASAATRAAADASAAAESASAQIAAAEAAKAELIANYAQIAEARGGLTAEMQAALAQETAIADEEIANYVRVAEAAQASAAEQAAAREEAVATATATSVASKAGLFGIIGGVAAAAIGIGLLVTQFHRSEDASAAAAKAAQAYTDALKGGTADEMAASLADTIVGDFTKAGLPDQITAVNSGLKKLGSSAHFTAAEFVTAVQTGGSAVTQLSDRVVAARADIQTKIEAYAKRGQVAPTAMVNTYNKLGDVLKSLNTEVQGYATAQSNELKALASFGIVAASVDQVGKALHLSNAEVKTYAQLAGDTADKNGVFAKSESDVETSVRAVASAFNKATATGSGFLSALQAFSSSAGTSADRAALIGATLKAGNGDALSYAAAMNAAATANHGLVDSLRTAASQVGKNGISVRALVGRIVDLKTGTINYANAAAAPLISGLQGIQSAAMAAASATYQHNRATEGGKRAADDAYKVYRSQTRGALMDEATHLGLTAGQAKRLADKYFGMPKKVKTLIEQEGANPVVTVLNQIGTQLSFLTHHPWNPTIGINDHASTPLHNIHDILNNIPSVKTVDVYTNVHDAVNSIPKATGGSVWGPGTGTSDSIPARLSNGEFVVKASQASKHRRLLENINHGAQGFAAGGPVGNAQQIASALRSAFGLNRNQIAGFLGNFQVESGFSPRAYNAKENAHGIAQWEGSRWTALQQYAKHMGVQATSMAAQTGFLVKELRGSGLVSQVKKMSDPARVAALVDAHYERSSGSTRGARIAAARAFAARGVAGGVGASAAASKAQVQSTNALVPDAHSIFGALSGSVGGMRQAVAAFIKDFRAAGATTRQIARATADDARLVANQQKIVAARSKLANVTQYSDSIRSTLTGTFDPTRFGSVADLIGGYQGQTDQNNAYTKEVNALRKRAGKDGSALGLINTLAASGQTASLESLYSGSGADLTNAGKAYRGYNSSVQGGVDAASTAKYGETQGQASRDVDRLVAHGERVLHALAQLGATVARSHGSSGARVEREMEKFAHQMSALVDHGRKGHA